MTKLVFATRNANKVRELAPLLPGIAIVTSEIDVVEDLPTFQGNALKKAREVAAAMQLPALADDSGLEVDALGGAPGVYSARYGGEPHDAAKNMAKLLAALTGRTDRTARFRCAIAFVDGDFELVTDGTLEGEILEAPRGTGGFGYDPLFLVPALGKTLAELPLEVKSTLSHRAKAVAAIRQQVFERLSGG